MESNETIQILNFKVEGAESIADLRSNVKLLKDELKSAEETADSPEGWKHYQETLELLKQNQNALKDAAYATSGSFEDVKKAAVGATTSYNGLVNKMAELKREFRSTNDEARRMELGKQINDINTQLKEMDALQGNFQRNVGNYQSAFKGMADKVDVFKKSLEAGSKGLGGLKDGMDGISKSPMIASLGLIITLAMKLFDAVKKDESATAALKKGMEALKPVMDFLSGIMDKIVNVVVDLIGKISNFLGSSGLFNKIINGVMGVGNAIVQFVIAPFKGIVEAIKVFKEKGISGLGDAAKAFGKEMKSGFSFKQNFEAGQAMGDAITSGAKSKKVEEKAKEAGKAVGKKVKEGLAKELTPEYLEQYYERMLAEGERRAAERKRKQEEYQKPFLESQKIFDELYLEEMKEFNEELDAELQEQIKMFQDEFAKEQEIADAKKALQQWVVDNTSDILGTIADLYEADEENAEKNAKKIKNLRIAAAAIDTLSGAVGAYMQAAKTYPPPYGQILGAASAAAVAASGLANIAKMKSTTVSADGGGSVTPTVDAQVAAPTVQLEAAQPVRQVTSASEEALLNRMASEQKVYLVTSELEMELGSQKVTMDEASF